MKIEDLPLDVRIEAASAYQSLRSNRQIAFGLARAEPAYRELYDDAQALYLKWCDRFGVEPEPVFDQEAYEKSDRCQAILRGDIR